jgi:hypothetical protein
MPLIQQHPSTTVQHAGLPARVAHTKPTGLVEVTGGVVPVAAPAALLEALQQHPELVAGADLMGELIEWVLVVNVEVDGLE